MIKVAGIALPVVVTIYLPWVVAKFAVVVPVVASVSIQILIAGVPFCISVDVGLIAIGSARAIVARMCARAIGKPIPISVCCEVDDASAPPADLAERALRVVQAIGRRSGGRIVHAKPGLVPRSGELLARFLGAAVGIRSTCWAHSRPVSTGLRPALSTTTFLHRSARSICWAI